MLRVALPQVLALLALNWMLVAAAFRGMYPQALLAPLQMIVSGVVLLLIFWRISRMANADGESRLRIASELAETKSLFTAVSDSVADPVLVWRQDGALAFANQAALSMLGKTWEQAANRHMKELLPALVDVDQTVLENKRVMEEKRAITAEHDMQLPQGAVTFATTRSPWLGPDDAVLGVIAVSVDIGRFRKTEDAVLAGDLQLEETVSRRTAALRRLADHLESVREEEKRAIARELHDDMGASLTSLTMHMEGAYPLLPGDPQWTERKAKIQTLLRSLVTTTRRMQTELRPTMLDLFGIKAAIHELTDDFRQRTDIVFEVSLPDGDVAISHKLEITVYRMLQELLNNVVTHAHASHVDVILDVDEDRVALTVRDNGIGMPPERNDSASGYGLRALEERAAFLGGTVTVSAGRAGGTVVTIELPLANDGKDPLGL